MSEGRGEEAADALRKILERYPDYSEGIYLIGRVYYETGMFEEAAEYLERRRADKPADWQTIEMLGQAYLELGRRGDAERTWHSYLTGGEKNAGRYLQVSRAEWQAGLFDEAIETLREGRRFPRYFTRFTAEIVRMEKTRGNYRAAFIEALPGFEADDMPDVNRSSGTISDFLEAGSPPELVAAVDSFAANARSNRPFFESLAAALRVETGDYSGASGYLIRAAGTGIPEKDLYALILHLYSLGGKAGDPAYEAYIDRASSAFIGKYKDSPRSPRVLLLKAQHEAQAAERGGPGARESALEAVALADSTMGHRRGRAYADNARLLKAKVLLEDLRDPDAALGALDGGQWRHPNMARQVSDLRLEALILSGRWDEALKRFDAQIASPDSSVAATGKYGRGMVLFYRGEFAEAGKALSETAEEAPWSRWANDALAVAVLIKRAESGDPAVLGAFAAAMKSSGRGRYGEGADSLVLVAGKYPDSELAPEALYQGAVLLARAGRDIESTEALKRVIESYPLSRAAPRAVETLAASLEKTDPEEAASWYALFLERYGDDPWATRVRSRYVRLRKSESGEDGET
jgi:tetratricopeptide (TPR) repeat protein